MDPLKYQSMEAGKPIQTSNGYWAFIPNPLPPALVWNEQLVSILAEAERELGQLSAMSSSHPYPHILLQPFKHTEAVISSHIEGTRTSLTDLYHYEIAQLSFLEPSGDAREVLNYMHAMDYGLECFNTLPVSLRLIRELHGILMECVRGGLISPGAFRHSQNWIGPAGCTLSTAPYVPPPIEEMISALNALEKFLYGGQATPPLVRLGLIHYQFEAIHPFLDGNGRVGRLLIAILLCAWGLLPQPVLNLSPYFDRYRQAYYDNLLAVSQNGCWEGWLIFFLRGLRDQAHDGIYRMDLLKEIRIKYQPVIDTERNKARMTEIVEFLFSRPILTIKQAADGLGIPLKTVGNYFAKLQRVDILHEKTTFGRNRIFQADEILNAIKGFDGLT
jgi:Fic family protein